MLQLSDCTIRVSERKSKVSISEMFTKELKFAADCLIKWFNMTIKSKNLELYVQQKNDYERKYPVDWENGKCCIYNFP